MTPTEDTNTARIREYVVKHFPAAEAALASSDNLLGSGVVDSLGILDIVDFVEAEFDIEIDEDEFVVENFASIDRIAEFVRAKSASA